VPEKLIRRAVLAALIILAAQGVSAQAATVATITPVLSPDRLAAKGALTLTIRYSEQDLGVPAPVRRVVLRLPVGLTLEVPQLRSCSVALLEARGASGCPRQSEIGTGEALVEADLGAEKPTERVVLRAFLGPPQNLQPTFAILAQGSSPFSTNLVLAATAQPDRAPFGERLVMWVPPISTLPPQPDVSIVSFSLRIGASPHHRTRGANTVLVPSRCPAGGFPFAAESTYADGSVGSARATERCPR
jgi:hypothetical protein